MVGSGIAPIQCGRAIRGADVWPDTALPQMLMAYAFLPWGRSGSEGGVTHCDWSTVLGEGWRTVQPVIPGMTRLPRWSLRARFALTWHNSGNCDAARCIGTWGGVPGRAHRGEEIEY